MIKTISILKEVTVIIDDDKIDTMLKDYQSCIDSTADIDDVFMQIGWSIGTHDSSFVEGCGEDGTDFKIKSNENIETTIEDYIED
jgi:hypothetical protein